MKIKKEVREGDGRGGNKMKRRVTEKEKGVRIVEKEWKRRYNIRLERI